MRCKAASKELRCVQNPRLGEIPQALAGFVLSVDTCTGRSHNLVPVQGRLSFCIATTCARSSMEEQPLSSEHLQSKGNCVCGVGDSPGSASSPQDLCLGKTSCGYVLSYQVCAAHEYNGNIINAII